MNKLPLTIVVALTAGLALPVTAAAAPTSSLAESRGYQNCRAAAERTVDLLSVNGKYYLDDRGEVRQYYMNGMARVDGATTHVKIACQTTVSGHRVSAVNVAAGEFAGRVVQRPAVAAME
jgi:hypothetical protein